ncbi:MAG: hypothetical protein M3P06_06570 [Acidobacteriota bacterium]|nr:hypothetical protein [Acidobacteriota bacterium]
MKEIAGVILATTLLLGMIALAVERGDRETFVSPPDAVAEGFAREVVTKRWDRARTYLADPDSMSNAEIAALQKSWEQRIGDPSEVHAETISRTEDKALVNVNLKSARGSEAHLLALAFDGEWKIRAGENPDHMH